MTSHNIVVPSNWMTEPERARISLLFMAGLYSHEDIYHEPYHKLKIDPRTGGLRATDGLKAFHTPDEVKPIVIAFANRDSPDSFVISEPEGDRSIPKHQLAFEQTDFHQLTKEELEAIRNINIAQYVKRLGDTATEISVVLQACQPETAWMVANRQTVEQLMKRVSVGKIIEINHGAVSDDEWYNFENASPRRPDTISHQTELVARQVSSIVDAPFYLQLTMKYIASRYAQYNGGLSRRYIVASDGTITNIRKEQYHSSHFLGRKERREVNRRLPKNIRHHYSEQKIQELQQQGDKINQALENVKRLAAIAGVALSGEMPTRREPTDEHDTLSASAATVSDAIMPGL